MAPPFFKSSPNDKPAPKGYDVLKKLSSETVYVASGTEIRLKKELLLRMMNTMLSKGVPEAVFLSLIEIFSKMLRGSTFKNKTRKIKPVGGYTNNIHECCVHYLLWMLSKSWRRRCRNCCL